MNQDVRIEAVHGREILDSRGNPTEEGGYGKLLPEFVKLVHPIYA